MSASKVYEVQTWFERDRAMVRLVEIYKPAPGAESSEHEIVCWFDGAVAELVEDGFLDPRDWRGSALEYAAHLGLVA